jgi:hypothetical protein
MKTKLLIAFLAASAVAFCADTKPAPADTTPSPELVQAQRDLSIVKQQRDTLAVALLDANKAVIDLTDRLQRLQAAVAPSPEAKKPEGKK